ncbi:phosphoglycolate phosphatase [Companilactobacillus sp. RD055328]|uniref:HAD-IA family hydrolase n=1 Tax=Companilactobacillus sp. RD055328 TaxID=2916634 RepID=UPI001FC86C7C|nr:HAD-IA family hydrolase [Companilactobacillus sp. RD055328]GKQ43245.1 phosphoglycolate phosphatase [Companilactobacillus sp. RD055328]
MISSVFFDLDGTIINSQEGIIKALQYMYEKVGIYHDEATLKTFIGPPLGDTFAKYDGVDPNDHEKIQDWINIFREYYDVKGWQENTIYSGVEDMLKSLNQQNTPIYIATSKPERTAKRILADLKLDVHIDDIFGAADIESERNSKKDVITYGLNNLPNHIDKKQISMVGDRENDIEGGHYNDLRAIGVLYGYGNLKELQAANSDWIVQNPLEIAEIVDNENK